MPFKTVTLVVGPSFDQQKNELELIRVQGQIAGEVYTRELDVQRKQDVFRAAAKLVVALYNNASLVKKGEQDPLYYSSIHKLACLILSFRLIEKIVLQLGLETLATVDLLDEEVFWGTVKEDYAMFTSIREISA